jgi:hypothetical protein
VEDRGEDFWGRSGGWPGDLSPREERWEGSICWIYPSVAVDGTVVGLRLSRSGQVSYPSRILQGSIQLLA